MDLEIESLLETILESFLLENIDCRTSPVFKQVHTRVLVLVLDYPPKSGNWA